jgi:inosine/xanthosine triphosphatase
MYKAIALGTKNQTKVQAVEFVLKEYEDLFPRSEIIPFSVESGVSEQPIGFDEIIQGAKNRAKHAFDEAHADLSMGIEDGIAKMPHTRTGYMNFCCCAIYDGHDYVIGMSGGYEYPRDVIHKVLNEKKDITQSFNEVGLSSDSNLGSAEGAIGVLTKGRENRIDGTQAALRRALIQLEHKDLF